nr:NUDIX hydrolase [Bifidobacterium scaligerum]
MITPADLARMLGQTPDSAVNYTQDKLLYTSQTPQNSADYGDYEVQEATGDFTAASAEDAGETADEPRSAEERIPVPQHPEPPAQQHPTPATVFGMHATVTIATPNETIVGQVDGIAGAVAPEIAPADTRPTPANVFGKLADGQRKPAVSQDPQRNLQPVQTVQTVTGLRELQHQSHPADRPTASPAHIASSTAARMAKVHAASTAPSGPTPAMMPQRRATDGPTTFASLDAQELPVVREYSAGGLIFDDRNRVAIIARHSRSGHLEWCLPKGHIEKGETPQQTAVREVHEETGILGEVIDSIATIDYWFTGTTQRVHKLVHHFALRQIGGELTVDGDPDHEAEDAIWVRFDDLDDVLSYPNERKIAWLYARKKNRQANE